MNPPPFIQPPIALHEAVDLNDAAACRVAWRRVTPSLQEQALNDAVRLGRRRALEAMLPLSSPHQKQSALTRACEVGDLNVVQSIIDAGADPSADSSEALWCACQQGNANVVAHIFMLSPSKDYPYALCVSALRDQLACVKILAPHTDLQECLTLARDMDQEGTYMWKNAVRVITAIIDEQALTQSLGDQHAPTIKKKM